jgi:hypothetical protein
MRQSATWRDALAVATLPLSMSTPSRIQQIIDHERSIHRSLTPFGLALALITVMLVVFVGRG